MAFIEWDARRYSVGVKRCDDDHKQLIRLINELHEAMKTGRAREIVGRILSELVDYVKVHFAAEEKLMQQKGYPKLQEHKRLHDALTHKVRDFQERFKAGEATVTLDLLDFLQNWLLNHIVKVDQQYTALLKD